MDEETEALGIKIRGGGGEQHRWEGTWVSQLVLS